MNEIFGQMLRSAMKNLGATQEMLSEDLGISQSSVSNYMNGRVPKADTLMEIASYLGVSANKLLTGREGLPGVQRQEMDHIVLWPLKSAQESLARITDKGSFVKGIRGLVMNEFTTKRMATDALQQGKIRVDIEHRTGDFPKGFPKTIELVAPSAKQGADALAKFLAEIEEREVLFACIEPKLRNAEFFDQLLTPSAYALCYAASQLLIAAFKDSQAELQARFDKLETEVLVTAHEDLLHEQERLRMFYPEFHEFVSRILNSEVARRLKQDYKPARKGTK